MAAQTTSTMTWVAVLVHTMQCATAVKLQMSSNMSHQFERSTSTNLVVNGDFESLPLQLGWTYLCPPALYNGHSDLSVPCNYYGVWPASAHTSGGTSGNVLHFKGGCYTGNRGGYYQDLTTQVGVTYDLTYAIIDGWYIHKAPTTTGTSYVSIQSPIGTQLGDYAHTTSGSAHDPAIGDWDNVGPITFTAADTTTRIYFYSGGNSCPNLDNVEVTPSSSPAQAVGDPHLQNVHGERFDLMKTGKHVLVNIPRGAGVEQSFLRVVADARHLGGQCADMYFQEVNVTGSWAEAKQVGGYHYSVSQHVVEPPEWIAFGKVGFKVVHGRTGGGLSYLNVYVKHLGRAGYAVGGLLGEDDHEDVTTPPEACATRLSLVDGVEGGHSAPSVLSVAVATLA